MSDNTEATRMAWIAWMICALGLWFIAAACLYTRTYDHEQLSLQSEHVEQAGITWELR